MRRREFIAFASGAAAAWPLAAHAQQASIRRVAAVMPFSGQADQEGQVRLSALIETLARLSWIDGQNIRLDVQWAGGDAAHYKAIATAVTSSSPEVIVTGNSTLVAQFQSLTKTIPIVFTQTSDSVGAGLVSNIARPGGNITGFENFEPQTAGKWLELLKEAAPGINRAAIVLHPENAPNAAFRKMIESIAVAIGVQAKAITVRNVSEIERGVATFAEQPDGGLIVLPHPITIQNRDLIIVLAARYRLPAIYPFRFFAASGGLMSYGPDQIEQWRAAAGYVDRILKGEKPGDLPVRAPSKFELVINLRTAKAIGLNVPTLMVSSADEVIE